MADDSDSKTEQPTQRRLSKAHDEGNLLSSQEVKTAAIIVGGLVLVWGIANPLMGRLERLLASVACDAALQCCAESGVVDGWSCRLGALASRGA